MLVSASAVFEETHDGVNRQKTFGVLIKAWLKWFGLIFLYFFVNFFIKEELVAWG